MTDLEITRLCALAMGYASRNLPASVDTAIWNHCQEVNVGFKWILYDPFHDDAQAMALMKEFHLDILWRPEHRNWEVNSQVEMADGIAIAISDDLNRAICECVAKMQEAKCRTK